MVSQNLREREVLYLPPRHRAAEQALLGHIHHPELVQGAGELPLAFHGRLERRGDGAAPGPDRKCQDPALAHDQPLALLDHERGRLHAGYQ